MIKPLRHLLAGALALVLAACSTVSSRIEEKPDLFAKLDPATQAKIKQGIIDVGFTPDMVYIALGKPDQARERVTAAGRWTIWIYNSYYDRYEGTVYAGYRRSVFWDPRGRGYRVFLRPVYADLYSAQEDTKIRVVFQNDRVTVIEQQKR